MKRARFKLAPIKKDIVGFVALINWHILLNPSVAQADVASAEYAFKTQCLQQTNNNTGCACLLTSLRREIPSGDYEVTLVLADLSMRGKATGVRVVIPAEIQNRYNLTPASMARLNPQMNGAFQRAQRHCSGR